MSKIVFKKLQAILERIPDELEGKEVHVGWLGNINEENGTPVSYVATIQEYGDPSHSIPPRPMLEPTMRNNHEAYLKFLKLAAKRVQDKQVSGDDALHELGERVTADIVKTIYSITSPALSPITLMLRKMKDKNPDLKVSGKVVGEAAAKVAKNESYSGVSTKPLVESETMVNAVTHEVVKK